MVKKDLTEFYENVYKSGSKAFFTFDTLDITHEILKELDWNGKSVLEIGCGSGETAAALSKAGAKKVVAFDFSETAIKIAKENHKVPNLEFQVGSFDDIVDKWDCIVLQEVIEHTDNPKEIISMLKSYLKPGGSLIFTCPSFMNLRGFVWMTLQLLFDVPMSLSDKHFIAPFEMERWAEDLKLNVSWRTFRYEQSHGDKMLIDMKKRLTNALRDAKMDNSKVDLLLNWLYNASKYQEDNLYNGAKGLYHFTLKYDSQ